MDLEITMDDIIKAGHCPSGARRWFREQGLYEHFKMLPAGGSVPAQILIDTGDALAIQVVERTAARRG